MVLQSKECFVAIQIVDQNNGINISYSTHSVQTTRTREGTHGRKSFVETVVPYAAHISEIAATGIAGPGCRRHGVTYGRTAGNGDIVRADPSLEALGGGPTIAGGSLRRRCRHRPSCPRCRHIRNGRYQGRISSLRIYNRCDTGVSGIWWQTHPRHDAGDNLREVPRYEGGYERRLAHALVSKNQHVDACSFLRIHCTSSISLFPRGTGRQSGVHGPHLSHEMNF
mmetsp:Transcript_13827/g.32261  ORF Transcript_13827/g.32261 Transcript_13827/m.32261 type:complete len:225 (-) Transcript_13827:358-1032(-)